MKGIEPKIMQILRPFGRWTD